MPATSNSTQTVKDKPIEFIPMDKLLLDKDNPRCSKHLPPTSNQRDILNVVVKQFGIDDVLSSISVSGYFSAEPLVCRREEDGKFTVVEGNRRLSACLVLAGDECAADHQQRTLKYQRIHKEHGEPEFNPIPCIVFEPHESRKMLMSYLGVRHIVSTKEWDSYAKAAWVSGAISSSGLSLDDIAEMIGDNRGTIKRLLQGYNFIGQLEAAEYFYPKNSVRKGRGSNTHYPFSWVYTILDSKSVREFIGLSDNPEDPSPIPEDKLEEAALVVRTMFGDTSSSEHPAIKDSRQLQDLSRAFASPEKVAYLRQGKSLTEIERITQPLSKLLADSLLQVRELLREAASRLDEEELDQDTARNLTRLSSHIARQAKNVNLKISSAAADDEME